MVKLFIGNIPPEATPGELKALFEQYGKVTECDIITNYGFVHMEEKKAADEAVANLNQYKLHDVSINVEHSRGKPKASTKLHVSSISEECTSDELREKFEEYGAVLECDIVKDFAFVHMEKAEEALEAIRNLNNHEFKGKRMHVQLSTSRLRVTPGMGERSRCYRCGKDGHWSGVCPLDQMAQEMDLASSYGHDPYADPYVPMRNAAAAYAERMYYERERRSLIDYYHRYRIRPSSYDGYMDRRLPPIPPPSVNALSHRKRLESSPYERHLLPPPPPPIPNYYARERSPIRRPATNAATGVDDYASDRRLAPTVRNTTTTTTLYETPRYMRNTYAAAAATDRTRYY